jgi:hypothetical protein
VFPFQFKGVWYDACINNTRKNFWCSLDRVFQNRWTRCQQACPLLARNLLKSSPSSTHTSCSQPNSAAKSFFPDDTQIKIILDAHNRIRSAVSPSAADMRVITWDHGLARMAQRRSETCTFAHDCSRCRRLLNNQTISIGQNAYMSFNMKYDPQTTWSSVVSSWESEISDFAYGKGI